MSDNNGGIGGIGRPGTREVINNKPRDAALIAIYGIGAALFFAVMWLIAILLAGWLAVYVGCMAVMFWFCGRAVRAAIKAHDKEVRLKYAISAFVCLAFVVFFVVFRDDLRALWPVPEVTTTEFPAAAEVTYEALDGCVYENTTPAAGCVITSPLGILTAKGDTLYIDGMPSAPLRAGQYADKADTTLNIDGKPLPVPFNAQFLTMSKRVRGGVALLAVFLVGGIVLANTVAGSYVVSSIAETLNKNAPPTYTQAPWYAGPLFWLQGMFNPQNRAQLWRHSMNEIGATPPEPQAPPPPEIIRETWMIGFDGQTTVSTNGAVATSPLKQNANRQLISMPDAVATEEQLTKLAERLNAGDGFTRETGTKHCGWVDGARDVGSWNYFRDEMVRQGAAEQHGNGYRLTLLGERYLSLYGYVLQNRIRTDCKIAVRFCSIC